MDAPSSPFCVSTYKPWDSAKPRTSFLTTKPPTAKSDRDQIMMFSRTLADNLEENHEVYAFAALLDTIPMESFLSQYSNEGGKAYHPSMMVACLLYGFHRGWRSSRELQKACEENDAMRYLVGGHKIKFRAIADFRVRFGKEIEEVFKYSVSLLSRKKKNICKDIKIDGTKIKASAADDQTYKKSDLEDRQESLREEILQYLSSGIELDIEEDKLYGKNNSGYEIDPEERNTVIQDFIRLQKEALQAKLKAPEKESNTETPLAIQENSSIETEAIQSAEEVVNKETEVYSLSGSVNENNASSNVQVTEEKANKVDDSNEDTQKTSTDEESMLKKAEKYMKIESALQANQEAPADFKINLTDPEGKFMKRNGKISQSYNVQVASSEGYILAADISEDNSENDLEQLTPTLSKVEENTGMDIEIVSADSGYFHASGLEYLDSKKIDGFIPSPNPDS